MTLKKSIINCMNGKIWWIYQISKLFKKYAFFYVWTVNALDYYSTFDTIHWYLINHKKNICLLVNYNFVSGLTYLPVADFFLAIQNNKITLKCWFKSMFFKKKNHLFCTHNCIIINFDTQGKLFRYFSTFRNVLCPGYLWCR